MTDRVITIHTPDNHLDGVLISAVRYCLGRRTYMPETVTSWIMGHCGGQLEQMTIAVMIRDIDEAYSLGDECDRQTWMRFREWLRKEAQDAAD